MSTQAEKALGLGLQAAERLGGRLFLNGALTSAHTSYSYESPAVPSLQLLAGNSSPDEAQAAVDAAAEAQESWASTPMMQRNRFVQQLGTEISTRHEEFAQLVVLESGKTIKHARAEVDFCLSIIETFASSVAELSGDAKFDFMTGRWVVSTKRPVGPSLLISPWNFPLNLGVRKVVTSLLAGCTFIWKPSDKAPLTAMAVGEALASVGLPPGVGAVLPTADSPQVVSAIMATGTVRKLSFTGSTQVGQQLMRQAADQMMRTSFELGGNGPAILGRGADLDKALPAVVRARFSNNGQVCTAINRLYVHSDDLARVVEGLTDHLGRMQIRWPHQEESDLGPLIASSKAWSLEELIKGASDRGATVRRIGEAPQGGAFVVPAIVTGLATDDPLCQTELFGPVLPVIAYNSFEDAVREANSTPYGLSAYVYSNLEEEVEYFKEHIRAGLVAVNSASPSSVSSGFGGIGWSGHGRENGIRGLDEFLDEITFVH
jgi:succinate-semialdehyde dehydrogenase/glutarate-semialdehyde dehydrogenase